MNESVRIPWDRLSPDQLRALAESFVLREGTDYGINELSHDEKTERLIKLIKSGQVHVTFDLQHQSFNIIRPEDQ